jgi:hypothetical protein
MRISADGIEESDISYTLDQQLNSNSNSTTMPTMAYNNDNKNNGLSSNGTQSANAITNTNSNSNANINNNNNNNNSSNNAELSLCNGERVKVIYRYSTPSHEQLCHKTIGFVPLTVIPIVDDKFHDGYYSNWDEVKNQVLNLNFNESTTKAPQNVSFIGKIGSEKDSTVLPLVTKDDYFTALKVAELCGEPLDVMIKDNNEAKSANAVQPDSGAIPKLRPKRPENCSSDTAPSTSESENEMLYVDRDGNISDKRKCPFSGNCRESAFSAFKPYGSVQQQNRTILLDNQIERLKKEITVDVTKNIIKKLSECLTEYETGDNNLDTTGKTIGHNDTETTAKNNLNQSSTNNKAPKVIHRGIICDHCDSRGIEGIRYKCSVCLDYDLCEKCESLDGVHNEDHSFIKIKQPIKRFTLPKKDEDIYLSLDVDLPSGRINFGDVKVVSKPTPTPTVVSNGSNTNQMSSSYSTAGTKSAMNASSKTKSTEKKLMKKKFEKKVRNQMVQAFQSSASLLCAEAIQPSRQELKPQSIQNQLQSNTTNALFLSGIFVSDETIPEGTKMPPNTKFRKTWKVRNTGSKAWTGRTTLRYVWGHSELEPYGKVNEIQAPPLKPGEEGRITIRFTAPKALSTSLYQSHWRLHHRGQPFGQRLVCRIVVDPTCTGVTQPNSSRSQPLKDQINKIKSDTHKLQRAKNLQENIFTAVKAIRFSLNENEHIPMKMNVKSHTTTPANTPFDISPPKSPEPQPIPSSTIAQIDENEVIIDDDKDKTVKLNVTEELQDEEKRNELDDMEESGSILSLSSSDSGDEFVVVPLPRCFDLNVPFSGSDSSPDVLNDIDVIVSDKLDEQTDRQSSLETRIRDIEEKIIKKLDRELNGTNEMDQNNAAVDNESNHVTNEPNIVNEAITVANMEDYYVPVNNNNVSATETEPTALNESNNGIANENEAKPKQTTKVSHQSTNPFRDTDTENVIHVLPESIVTGALSAAAHVYNNVSRALFPRNESNNDSRHFAWITSPPPAAIPLPERYWDNNVKTPLQYQPREFFSTTCASTNSTLTTTSNNAGNFTTKSAKSPTGTTATKPPVDATEPNPLKTALSQLYEMGFWNQSLNEELLQKNSFDVNDTIEDLLSPERGRERRLQARQRSDAANSEQVVSRQPSHVTPNGFIDEFD